MPTEQEKIKELEKELSMYRVNGAAGYYYELNRWVNGTVSLMRESGAKSLLTPSKDEDAKKFEKMMALIKNTKEWIDNMDEIKIKFKLSGDQKKDEDDGLFIETIARERK